ncbi:alpha/beta-hydrolase [Lophiostoma macrostomum CBS 122681]|uniref:Alpha/beta-hydrolase n=1 Tax=Lophiostoma macrostomum CBS 122681 TaxID=1314788 RepID=A0A6A6SPV5_9PLEO|nr:alpha/beta-hydrolase [Lophiostoma macrostomum CBS 122681]
MPDGTWVLGDLFTKDYGHARSIQKLWTQRWKFPCSKAVYPFHDGQFSDFEPIFDHLIKENINDPYTDEYTNAFLPTAEDLVEQAETLERDTPGKEKNRKEAIDLYLRANAVFRIARFPYIGTPLKEQVFERQKEVYAKGFRLWDVPIEEVIVPHTYAANGDGADIPLYIRKPPTSPQPQTNGHTNGYTKANPQTKKHPVILLITGLDGHRPDNTLRTTDHLTRNWATLICDIPGTTRDCPSNRRDPLAPDRLFTSILDYIAATPDLDERRVIAWGLSAGGYYAIRLAHTHRERLLGAVGHGAGTHHYIGAEWLRQVGKHEYPFGLERAYVAKYGYADFDELMERCQDEFSLVSGKGEGVPVVGHGMSSCRLLLVNGTLDGCMPIEDSALLADYGSVKEMRFLKGRAHMGYPEANGVVFPWMESVMRSVEE